LSIQIRTHKHVIIGGIDVQAFDNSYTPIIDSNYIETYREGIRKSFGSNPTIRNNTIILKGVGATGMRLSTSDSAKVYNNLIYAQYGHNGIENTGTQYIQLFNNYLTGNFNGRVLHIGSDNDSKAQCSHKWYILGS
jgi:hypothetical protein